MQHCRKRYADAVQHFELYSHESASMNVHIKLAKHKMCARRVAWTARTSTTMPAIKAKPQKNNRMSCAEGSHGRSASLFRVSQCTAVAVCFHCLPSCFCPSCQ
eukprot:gnl/TRDRNA2_/TRDRNA2_123897_c0_seq1.p1 gnl/TRDRNA2_/TRDRNA2_123897_c0~~gnl/TRDRNA2_/TRDRNA2_123897_c0_seq1.p1  ORF type:complete len:103 (+),score=7.35 gnl/TRDRNA2_/TRDRNA2_123897_c0_seq1:222-530(+)